LRFAVHLHHQSSASAKDIDWEIPVLATEATRDVGVLELWAEIRRHRAALESSGALASRRRARRRAALETLLAEELLVEVLGRVRADAEITGVLDAVSDGALDRYAGAQRILSWALRPPPDRGRPGGRGRPPEPSGS